MPFLPEPRFLTRDDGAEIAWYALGDDHDDAVLLVMGLGYPAAMWHRLAPLLAQHHRVLLLDNRGAGSTGDVVGAPYTIPLMAADAIAVLDEAGIASAHIVGLSMGGMIAQEMAYVRPERVRSLCIMSSHAGIPTMVLAEGDAFAAVDRDATLREIAEASIPFNYAESTPREWIEEDWAVRFPLASTQEGFMAQLTGASTWDGLGQLADISAPTLIIHGEDDKLIPAANGHVLAEGIRGARLEMLRNANHILITDQHALVGTLVTQWLARQPPR